MTFRSFSRLVRWYRWPLRVGLASVVVPAGVIALDSLLGALFWIFGMIGLSFAVLAALSDWASPRHRVRERRRRMLRVMPLRGWTK